MADHAPKSVAYEQSIGPRALEDAFACYQNELLGMFYHMVGNSEDAQDGVQDTFIKCWRNREKVAEVRNLKAWIFRIAMNTARDMRQTAWRRKKKALSDDEQAYPSQQQGPDALAERHEQMAMLRQAISQLRDEEQEVFLLRQNAQMTYDEIAETVGIPSGTVKTRMRLALGKLRQTFSETAKM